MPVPVHRRAIRPTDVAATALLAMSAAAYLVVWQVVLHQPFFVGAPRLHSFDLGVYRAAANVVLHGRALYDARLHGGMQFTYPPAAALLFIPDRLFGLGVDEVLHALLGIVMLVAIIRLTPRLRSSGARALRWDVTALVAAVLLWCEPVTSCLGYGQIDLLITWLLVADLARGSDARGRGWGVGLAAGLKLTPLLFIPYLLCTRDRRAAVTGVCAFLTTVVVGFLVLPRDAWQFWSGGLFMNSGRMGNLAAPINQSLAGTIARATQQTQVGHAWTLVLAAIAIGCLVFAVRAARRGDRDIGFAVCAIASLLVSPVSWTHHWVLAIPAAGLLLGWAWRRRAWAPLACVLGLCAIAYGYVPELIRDHQGLKLSPIAQLAADPYVILAVATLVTTALAAMRARRGAGNAPSPGEVLRPAGAATAQPAIRAGQV